MNKFLTALIFSALLISQSAAQGTRSDTAERNKPHEWTFRGGKTVYDPQTKTFTGIGDNGTRSSPVSVVERSGGWDVDWGRAGCGFHGFGGKRGAKCVGTATSEGMPTTWIACMFNGGSRFASQGIEAIETWCKNNANLTSGNKMAVGKCMFREGQTGLKYADAARKCGT
jgi:hypothetical protein